MTTRPTLSDISATASAEEVAGRLAAELQRSVAASDADGYDNSFAADVLWGGWWLAAAQNTPIDPARSMAASGTTSN
ncbi:hypothetical protein [Nocardia terpenica]|uniref:Uncharacterized protein n=1 Tax=Nocardia terpenica TaxID=455432 RepID=A0A291RRM8_9NOCA|nr:hypothetical protein [Nocardia terpenica]ATL70271.1 hypothetical protein CRH09_32900 [Nocardia terpenica]